MYCPRRHRSRRIAELDTLKKSLFNAGFLANQVMHTHLVLRTTFHNKRMMSSSVGALVFSFLYLLCYLPLN